MVEVTHATAELASLTIEAFLNGVFLMLFCLSTHFMVKRRSEQGHEPGGSVFRDPLFIASALMGGMSSIHWTLSVYHSFMAFIQRELGSPENYYLNMEKASFMVQTAIVVCTLAIGNIILFNRVWTIWEGNLYAMMIPVTSFVSAVACAIGMIVAERRYTTSEIQAGIEVKTWLRGAFISDMFANITSSGLIIWKLWRMTASPLEKTPGSWRIYWTISVFVESSALYVAWNIVFTAVFGQDSPVWAAIADTWVSISGISFALINIRVGLGCLFKRSGSAAFAQSLSGARRSAFGDVGSVRVTVTREVETYCSDRDEFVISPQY